MSAFFDIWFGKDELTPQHTRLDNTPWQKESFCGFNIYTSLPGLNSLFISKTEVPDYCMIVLGQFYEKVDKLTLIEQCINYSNGDQNVFDDPAGHYIIFLLDAVKNKYHVFTNRFGTYHAYWNSEGCIGTFFMGMARQSIRKDLDWEGITGFFGMGFFPNDKTYLQNIKILSPASYYSFDKEMKLLKQEKYWQWASDTVTPSLPESQQQLNTILKESTRYALQDHRVALPISGGLDSRMLAGVITDSGVNSFASLWGYSYGYTKDSVETSIAERIAEAKGISFSKYIVPDYLFKSMDTIIDSVDLFQYVDGTRQAGVIDILKEKSDVVIGGHWGDVWMDTSGLDITSDDPLTLAFRKKIVKKGSDWLLENVCENHLKNSAGYLNDYFSTTIRRYDHIPDADKKFKAYKTDEWSFRWTLASVRMYQAASFPILPFYDKGVAALLFSLPEDILAGRKYQVEFIKRFYPELARIKWQEYGRNLYSYKHLNNRNIVYRAVSKARRVITGTKPVMRNWEIFYLNSDGRRNLEHILLNSRITDVMPVDKLESLLIDFYNNPTAANGYRISMLHTFAQFLKKLHE